MAIYIMEPPKIPTSEIYKICLLNASGNISKIIVFSGNNIINKNNSELFSEPELKEYEEKNIPIIHSDHQIHKDDSIYNIKKKQNLSSD